MAAGLRRLYQGKPTAETAVITATTRTAIKTARVSNTSGAAGLTYSMSIVPGGGTDAPGDHRVAQNVAVAAGDPVTDDALHVLEVGDSVSMVAAAGLVVTITGITGLA